MAKTTMPGDTGHTTKSRMSRRRQSQKSERPSRKQRWTAPRWALLTVTLFLLCVEIGLYTSSPDPFAAPHLVPALVLMGLTLAINWNIFPTAMLYMTIWSVMTLVPTANGSPFMPVFLLCIVVIILNCTVRQMLWSFLVPAIAFTLMLIADQQRFRLFSIAGIGDEFVTLALNISLAALAGLSIRFALKSQEARAQKAELRLAREEADRLGRDILLAGQMHDNLTNDLTTILTLAYAHTHDEPSQAGGGGNNAPSAGEFKGDNNISSALGDQDGQARDGTTGSEMAMNNVSGDPDGDWGLVSKSADHALATAHKAIDVLRGRGGQTASFGRKINDSAPSSPKISDFSNSVSCGGEGARLQAIGGEGINHSKLEQKDGNDVSDSFSTVLTDTVRKEAAELNYLGFAGSVNIDQASLPSSVSPAVCDEAVRLVREICANVRRHGSTDGDWSLSIRGGNLSGDIGTGASVWAIVIVGMNTIDGDRPIVGKSGRGLKLHRQTLARLGGSLTTSSNNGIWTIRAVIPVHPSLARSLGR